MVPSLPVWSWFGIFDGSVFLTKRSDLKICNCLKPVFIILEVLLLFNLLIFVHELGHFLAARWRGLKIERFAVWFGKPIWKAKINGVEYALGSIPAGGYVSLPQMAPMEIIEGKGERSSEPLPPISALDKIIVAVAGPLFSFGLAFAFAFIVWGVGRPEAKESTTVGWVVPDGPAWKAGLRPGDKIIEVDNNPVTTFAPPSQDSVTWRIVTSEGDDIPIKYLRNGKEETARVIPTKLPTKWYERKSLRKILIGSASPAIIAKVATNSPAAQAGLKEGDEVIRFNGEKVFSAEALISAEEMLTNSPNRQSTFTIRRGTNEFEKTLLAEKPIEPGGCTPFASVSSTGLATLTKRSCTRLRWHKYGKARARYSGRSKLCFRANRTSASSNWAAR